MTSIAPVRKLRLYTNIAPNIIIPIGQIAARAPSNAPVATSRTPILYTAIHSIAVIIRPMPQALKPDILNAVIEMISHAIGITARITCNNITLSLSLVFIFYGSTVLLVEPVRPWCYYNILRPQCPPISKTFLNFLKKVLIETCI